MANKNVYKTQFYQLFLFIEQFDASTLETIFNVAFLPARMKCKMRTCCECEPFIMDIVDEGGGGGGEEDGIGENGVQLVKIGMELRIWTLHFCSVIE